MRVIGCFLNWASRSTISPKVTCASQEHSSNDHLHPPQSPHRQTRNALSYLTEDHTCPLQGRQNKKLQFRISIIYSKLFVIFHSSAECGYSRVIFQSEMSHQIRKTIDSYLCACFLGIVEEQIFSGFLGTTIFRIFETPR